MPPLQWPTFTPPFTYLVTGKIFNPTKYDDVILLSIFLATTVYVGKEVGKTFFYTPFVTNYMFAFALLLFFLAIVSFYQSKKLFPPQVKYAVTIIAGLLAGLSNEHTVPSLLGLGLLWMIWDLSRKKTNPAFMYNLVAYLSLLIGYLALYFAPGQKKRYGSVKNDGFESLLSDIPARLTKIFKMATSGSWQLVIVLGIFLLLYVVFKKNRNKNTLWQVVLFCAAIGMALTVIASPKVGQRLVFASYTAIGLGYVGMFYSLRKYSPIYISAAIITFGLNFQYMKHVTNVYGDYQYAFRKQAYEIHNLKQEGQTDLILKPLDFNFQKHGDFIYPDSVSANPKSSKNRYRARVYGVNSIAYKKK